MSSLFLFPVLMECLLLPRQVAKLITYSARLHNKVPPPMSFARTQTCGATMSSGCDRRRLTGQVIACCRSDFCNWVIAVISCEEAGQILSPRRLRGGERCQRPTSMKRREATPNILSDWHPRPRWPHFFFSCLRVKLQNTLLNLPLPPRQRGTACWQTGGCISLLQRKDKTDKGKRAWHRRWQLFSRLLSTARWKSHNLREAEDVIWKMTPASDPELSAAHRECTIVFCK